MTLKYSRIIDHRNYRMKDNQLMLNDGKYREEYAGRCQRRLMRIILKLNNMGKIRVDILIKGDLVCKRMLTGGVKSTLVKKRN